MARNRKRSGLSSGRLKILLLVLAFIIMAGILWYTHNLVRALQVKEKEVVDLYARSIEFLATDKSSTGDLSFVFEEIIRAIDFPLIQTDGSGEPIQPYPSYCRNVELDSLSGLEQQREYLKAFIAEMDAMNQPIAVTYEGNVLSLVHYGESPLVRRLRWLPYIEFSVGALFILIGYISFSYIKRTEQSNIWVGMARETAHQLGTPLSSMIAWIELLLLQASESPPLQITLREMEADLKRLQLIADRFSKIGSRPDLKQENVVEVIQRVFTYFERRIPRTGKKITLKLTPDTPVYVQINAGLFEWVIENLIKNALDAMEKVEGAVTVAVSETGSSVIIDVSDTGKGIDIAFKKDIFRPGFSTKTRGWGLGLSLSRRIVESYHKGRLLLKDSTPGVGTTFRIKLRKD